MGRIGSKIIKNQILMLVVVLILTILLFFIASSKYLFYKAKAELRQEADQIEQIVRRQYLNDLEKVKISRNEFKIANRFMNSNIIVSNRKRILFESLVDMTEEELLNSDGGSFNTVIIKRTIKNKRGAVIGEIVLGAKLDALVKFNMFTVYSLIIVMIIPALLALILGIRLERSITNPLVKLTERVNSFRVKETIEYEPIKTGDEIEKLDECFRNMAIRIKEYDNKKDTFIQTCSHELKTPLMSIRGYAEAIKDGVVDRDNIDGSLDIIIEESVRLTDLVNSILYTARLEENTETYNLRPVDICGLIRRSIASVDIIAGDKNIDIAFDPQEEHIIRVDEEKLYRAITNIIDNGIRYANQSINIEIKNNKSTITIYISDDGRGINPGEEEKIFEKLYKTNNGKTGLGLYIVRMIIESHGGKIVAYNNMKNGATFEINLPIT